MIRLWWWWHRGSSTGRVPARGHVDRLHGLHELAARIHDLAAIDREERGEPRQHRVPLRECDDLVLEISARAGGVLILEVADRGTRPARREPRGSGGITLAIDRRAHRLAEAGARDLDPGRCRRRTVVTAEHRHRRTSVDIRQLPRRDARVLDREPEAAHREVGHDRRADPAMDLRHHHIEPVLGLDQLAQSPARSGEPLEERGVDRLIDAEREHAHVPQIRPELAQDLILVADLTVGDEHDHALAIIGASSEHRGSAAQRLGELGATAGIDLRERLDRLEPVAIGGLDQRGRRDQLDDVVERDRAEPIARGQGVDHPRGCSARGHHLPAAHAAGAIDHDHDVAWLRGNGRRARWHQRERERAGLAIRIIDADKARPQLRAVDMPAQNEVAIEPLAGLDLQHLRIAQRRRDGMQAGRHLAQRTTLEGDADAEAHGVRAAGEEDRRRDPRCIGNEIGVARRAEAGLISGQCTARASSRHESRRDHEREPERDLAVVDGEGTHEREANRGGLTRHQVSDAQREHARPLLLGDGCAMTARDRLVVLLAGGAALLDHALDHAPRDLHAEAMHGGAIGQRKHVRRLDRRARRVDERLRDLDRRDHACDSRMDIHRGQR